MASCEVCGNEYDKAFQVVAAGRTHVFDSLECAIHRMAPICEHCGCKVIGHGHEVEDRFFCCAHCARTATGADCTDRHTARAQGRAHEPSGPNGTAGERPVRDVHGETLPGSEDPPVPAADRPDAIPSRGSR